MKKVILIKNVYEQLGHVAGYEKGSKLPEVGEFEISKDISKITVYYRNEEGEDLLEKDEYFASFDKEVVIITVKYSASSF